MSRTLARGLTAMALAALASFGLTGVAHAATTCGYAGQPACLPASSSSSVVEPGEPVVITAGPVQPGETGPIILASVGGSGNALGHFGVPSATGTQTLAAGAVSARALGRVAAATTTIGTYTADSAGIIHDKVVIPDGTAPGKYTINLPGHLPSGQAVTYFVPITVVGEGQGGGLPFTGAEIGIAAATGAALLAAGTAAVVSARRRRATVEA